MDNLKMPSDNELESMSATSERSAMLSPWNLSETDVTKLSLKNRISYPNVKLIMEP